MFKDFVREGELRRLAPWIGVALLILVTVALQTSMESVCWDDEKIKAAKINEAAGCFEFWLNRYQSLIGALAAVGAAALAWVIARRQIIAMEQQTRIALGDIQPTVFLEQFGKAEPRLTKIQFTMANENRRPLIIRRIELLTIRGAIFVVYERVGNFQRQKNPEPYGRAYDVRIAIEGTRPSAEDAAMFRAEIWIVWDPNSVDAPRQRTVRDEVAEFAIEYDYIGGDMRRERMTIATDIQLRG